MLPIAATAVVITSALYFATLILPIHKLAKKISLFILTKSFYNGFDRLKDDLAKERTDSIVSDHHGVNFPCKNIRGENIEALYLPSQIEEKTGNVVVICLNTTYQDHHPRNWMPYLENGADVLMWNPTQNSPIDYSDELSEILKKLRQENPDQVIAVKSYCASTDPAIRAVDLQNDGAIHLIVDRGHGNAQKIARSMSLFAGLWFVKEVINEKFDCHGIDRIGRIQGRSLFMSPVNGDQMMDCGVENLTRDLYEQTRGQTFVELTPHDHWSNWDNHTFHEVLKFLANLGVVRSNFSEANLPEIETPGCFARKCIPLLTKACI
jgi:hypothetical protein